MFAGAHSYFTCPNLFQRQVYREKKYKKVLKSVANVLNVPSWLDS